jgi:phage terminase small subunit
VALTSKQRKFIEVYAGNGTEAARLAGYSGNDNTLAQAARELLRNPHVAAAIREREAKEMRPHIATRLQRQAFWTQVMQDELADLMARLRASELLGKSEADFKERVEHSGTLTLEQLVLASQQNAEGNDE